MNPSHCKYLNKISIASRINCARLRMTKCVKLCNLNARSSNTAMRPSKLDLFRLRTKTEPKLKNISYALNRGSSIYYGCMVYNAVHKSNDYGTNKRMGWTVRANWCMSALLFKSIRCRSIARRPHTTGIHSSFDNCMLHKRVSHFIHYPRCTPSSEIYRPCTYGQTTWATVIKNGKQRKQWQPT